MASADIQFVSNENGEPTAVIVPIELWREIESDSAGLVENDDLAGTERLLQRWHSADRIAMSAAARRCFSARFDIRRTAENMIEVLQS